MKHCAALRTAGFALALALAGCGGASPEPPSRSAREEIRYVPEGDLSIIDPFVSTSSVTMTHAYMVYDTLFSLGSDGKPRPQMVGEYETSADQRTWRFRLRPELYFHDGQPVTAADVVASFNRWLQVSLYGAFLAPELESVRAIDAYLFEIRLYHPVPNLLEALAEPTRPTFVMRAQDASQPAHVPVRNAIGSGPFIMEMDQWLRGSKIRYRRNPAYIPRDEAPDGYAGGKRVFIDRVVWEVVKDANTALQALAKGEVDILEAPHPDLLRLVRDNDRVKTRVINDLGQQIVLRPNSLAPPLDNPAVRRVLLYAVNQSYYLSATGVEPEDRTECWRILMCSRFESDEGVGDWARRRAEPAQLRAMLAEAGYKGESIVILNPVDLPTLSSFAMITSQSLRDAGFNVDLQAVDGNTFFTRRAIKTAPAEHRGGWHIFHSVNSGSNVSSVVLNPGVVSACDGRGWFGWPCDPKLDEIRKQYFFASSEPERRAAAEALQRRFYETVPYVPLGEFRSPIAHRADIISMVNTPRVVFWGLQVDAPSPVRYE